MATTRKSSKNPASNPVDFEKALAELDRLIAQMEGGQLTLEASLQCFEEGIGLIRQCQQTLTAAEQKIQLLTAKNDNAE